jgi:hypothetical protein
LVRERRQTDRVLGERCDATFSTETQVRDDTRPGAVAGAAEADVLSAGFCTHSAEAGLHHREMLMGCASYFEEQILTKLAARCDERE